MIIIIKIFNFNQHSEKITFYLFIYLFFDKFFYLLLNTIFKSLKLTTLNYANLLFRYFSKHTTVDDSSLGNPGVSGFGGLFRNSDGGWLHGYAGNIDVSNIFSMRSC